MCKNIAPTHPPPPPHICIIYNASVCSISNDTSDTTPVMQWLACSPIECDKSWIRAPIESTQTL